MKIKSKFNIRKKEILSIDKPEVAADHELFLQAFEKPTQIYRYLRTRNILSPIFMQRNLYYMKTRMSRTHKNRSLFKLESLLNKVQSKHDHRSDLPGTFMNLAFSGFYYSTVENSSNDVARVDTHIMKICHKKRKEASAPLMQASVGTHDIPINPPEDSTSHVTLSIPTHNFTPNNGHQVKSYIIIFRVSLVQDQENIGEPLPKRRRISRSTPHDIQENHIACNNGNIKMENDMSGKAYLNTFFGAELVVYDRHSRCLLTPGYYELVLHPLSSDSLPHGKSSPKKNASWETIESVKLEGPFESLKTSPLLKFYLTWTEDTSSSISDKLGPRPLQPLDLILANKTATKPKQQGVLSPEAPQLVIYQFVYNNNSKQQTEARRDFHCPWCSLNCMALYSLLKHLKLCHARFSFTYVPHPKGAQIDVALNECYDGSYAGNPQDLVTLPAGFAFSRSGPTRRTPTTAILVCRPKRPKASLSEFLEQDDNDFDLPRSYILGHNRLYHHTMMCLPIQPHELDEDSEGEHDNEWVRTKTKMMIDEFTDVNEGEKEVMKMWNLHIMKHNFVGDCHIPLACTMFIETHGTELLRKNLYRNFVLHLASLHDFGLIGSGIVYKCIFLLQQRMEDPSIQATLFKHWEEQKQSSKLICFPSPIKKSCDSFLLPSGKESAREKDAKKEASLISPVSIKSEPLEKSSCSVQ